MALHLHLAPRTDELADALAGLLARPVDDPFVEEVVVVPAKGVERWLAQRMSHRLGAGPSGDGVCAGVRFLNPHSLVALLTGTERDDPWHPDRLAWSVLAVLDESLDDFPVLARHLGSEHTGVDAAVRRDRRWSVARRLAGILASYAAQRPQVLVDWSAGRSTDGAGEPLTADLDWQPELWRRVAARVGGPTPAERHEAALAATGRGEGDLPDRLSMFGHTRMPATEVALLGALSEAREVHLWLPQPSPGLWADLAPLVSGGPCRRAADGSSKAARHPLLASLGRDTRELQRTLATLHPAETGSETHSTSPSETLLGRLQADVRANRPPTPARVAAGDGSLQIHACHGLPRQVEVLRDVLVGLMEDDPTLEPRDIVIMCPDVETAAPLIQASFGLVGDAIERHPAHGLRVHLADRGLRHVNPLLALASDLLALAVGRATASQILDLAASEVVRRRWSLSDDDLAQLARWVGQAAIRWGLDSEAREPFGLAGIDGNTWEQGLDRLLLGVAMADDDFRVVGQRIPIDDVTSGDIDLVGRIAEFVARLEAAVTRLRRPASVAVWSEALSDAVHSLAATSPTAAWQVSQFERELSTFADQGSGSGELTTVEMAALLAARLEPRPTRSSFRTGTLTVCTLVPMRSVPHRVVCLLGLDDAVFPRSIVPDGDDLLARSPMTGERDGSSEDRQLFLDAILAASDTLVVTYSGASPHNGQQQPPSVPLGELIDAAALTCEGGELPEHVHRRHPLQAHDEANFDARAPFSFDHAARRGALARRDQVTLPDFLSTPLADAEPDLTLDDLTAFFRNPARAMLTRLEISTPRDGEEIADALPIDLGSLEAWAIGDRIVQAVLQRGLDSADAVMAAELARGELPPGALGEHALRGIVEVAQDIVTETMRVRAAEPEVLPVTLDLDGFRLVGAVGGIHGGAHVLRAGYSSVRSKTLLPTWIELLAVSAAHPERTFVAHVLGRPDSRGHNAHHKLGPVDAETARALLVDLVRLRDEGLRRPLLLPLETAAAWAEASRAGEGRQKFKALDAWQGIERSPVPGEREDAAWVRVVGHRASLDALGTGFGSLADRVWYPLLDARVVVR